MKRTFDTISLLKSRYEGTSCFYFSIFRYLGPLYFSEFQKDTELIVCLLHSDEFMQKYPEFFPISDEYIHHAICLNRYEFEGSLINMLIQGTCTDSIVSNEDEARLLVSKLLTELRLDNTDTIAFKINYCEWTVAAKDATALCLYVVYQTLHRYWMIMGFIDYY